MTWRERNIFDLFDDVTGGYIGRVSFPYATELMASLGDRVWPREEGPSGEPLVGVYRLRAASAAIAVASPELLETSTPPGQ